MSEMFTKCNGFIVSGDPLVYADSATMTGQGTVSEPFGVKSTDLFVQEPLYTGVSGNSAYIGWNNETVLYENYPGCTFGGTLTANEPVSAFERYKIYLRNSERQNQTVIEKYVNPSANTATTNKIVVLDCFQAGGGSNLFFTINCGQGVWNDSWTVFNYTGGYAGYFKADGTFNKITEATGSLPAIQKIVGINRKV